MVRQKCSGIRRSYLGVISVIGLLMMPETAPQRLKREYQQWQKH